MITLAPYPFPLAVAAQWIADGRFPVLFRRGFDGGITAACGTAAEAPCGDAVTWREDFTGQWRELRDAAAKRGIDPRLPILFHCFFDPPADGGAPWNAFHPVALHIPACVYSEHDGKNDMICSGGDCSLPEGDAGTSAARERMMLDGVEWECERYRFAVRQGLEAIARGDARKIVLAREIAVRCTRPPELTRVFAALLRRQPRSTVLAIVPSRDTAFICATPERLVRVEQGMAHTVALAGTLWGAAAVATARTADASEAATNVFAATTNAPAAATPMSEKLREEHGHVTDMLRAELGALSSDIEVGATTVADAGQVRHYSTPVSARLRKGVGLPDAVAALHPTPAVAGVPRNAAMDLIRRIEQFPRGLYAGAAGWSDREGNGEAVVTIRSALITGADVRVYAGAGIVRGSDEREEEEETRMKAQGMLEALQEG